MDALQKKLYEMEKANPSQNLDGQRHGLVGRVMYAMKYPYKENPEFKREVIWDTNHHSGSHYFTNYGWIDKSAQTINEILTNLDYKKAKPGDLDEANTLGHKLMNYYIKWGRMDKSAEMGPYGSVGREITIVELAYRLGDALIHSSNNRDPSSLRQNLESARFYWEVMSKLITPFYREVIRERATPTTVRRVEYADNNLEDLAKSIMRGFIDLNTIELNNQEFICVKQLYIEAKDFDKLSGSKDAIKLHIMRTETMGKFYDSIMHAVNKEDYDNARLLHKQAEDFDKLSGGEDRSRLAMIGRKMTLLPRGKLQENAK